MKDTFDKIIASRPVNKSAALAMSGGVDYQPNKRIDQKHWKAPPRTKAFRAQPKNPEAVDLTGIAFGRFIVTGYLGKGKWLVRCKCGDYETRNARSIRNNNNSDDRCDYCRHLSFLQRKQRYHGHPVQTGQSPPAEAAEDN